MCVREQTTENIHLGSVIQIVFSYLFIYFFYQESCIKAPSDNVTTGLENETTMLDNDNSTRLCKLLCM